MANLSNINNKLIVTDGGNLLVNTTANLTTYGGLTIDNISNPSIAMKTNNASGWIYTQYINSSGTNNFSMGVNQTIPYWGVKTGAGMDNPALAIISSGNVGIGTTSPSKELTITGTAPILRLQENSASSKRLDISISSSAVGRIGANQSASALAFETTGSERMRITSAGNVGIGTTSPSHLLSIGTEGNASGKKLTFYLGGSDGNYAGIGAQRGETNLYCSSEIRFINESNSGGSGAMSFNTGLNSLNERIRITSAGNVGIGTTSPGTFLQLGSYPVSGTYVNIATYPAVPDEHMIHLTAPSTTGYYGGGISFGENAFTAANITAIDAGGGGALHLAFGTGNSSGMTEKMRIQNNGNVGIGVDPSGNTDRLQIDNPSNPTSIRIGDNTTDDCYIVFNTDGNDWSIGADRSDSNKFKISDYSRVGTNDRLIIDTSGNVGIGENSPGTKLTIKQVDDTFNDLDLLQLKRVWSTASGSDRAHGISFNDTNATLVKIYADRTNSGSNYDASLRFFVNSGASGTSLVEAASINNSATLQVNPLAGSYGIRQNGVSNISNSGYVAGNATLSIDYDIVDQGSMFIECVFNHYGFITSYGCARIATVGMGPNIQVQDIQNISSSNGGAWTINRISNTEFNISKTAGTYSGGGYWYINIRGTSVKYT